MFLAFAWLVRVVLIAVDLLEKFTRKEVLTPDSEEGGVITPDFTSPVKVGENIKNQWFGQTFKFLFWQ